MSRYSIPVPRRPWLSRGRASVLETRPHGHLGGIGDGRARLWFPAVPTATGHDPTRAAKHVASHATPTPTPTISSLPLLPLPLLLLCCCSAAPPPRHCRPPSRPVTAYDEGTTRHGSGTRKKRRPRGPGIWIRRVLGGRLWQLQAACFDAPVCACCAFATIRLPSSHTSVLPLPARVSVAFSLYFNHPKSLSPRHFTHTPSSHLPSPPHHNPQSQWPPLSRPSPTAPPPVSRPRRPRPRSPARTHS